MMAFQGFLSINRAMEVYMLVLFGLDCLQMLVFKYPVGLSSNVLSFSIVRNVCFSRRRLGWCMLDLPRLNSFHF